MKYILFLTLSVFLMARENPFMPSGDMDEDKIQATNAKPKIEDFEKKDINLPNDARILKYITLGYQAIDGSIKEKKVSISENIDWHDTLTLSIKDTFTPIVPPIATNKPLVIKSMDKNTTSKKSVPKKSLKIVKKPKKMVKKVKSYPFTLKSYFSFDVKKQELTIHTKDTLIRDFRISKPYKLALDFKRKSAFYTKTTKINLPPFKSVTVGAHGSFYRTSFLLDGPYTYKITKKNKKIIVKLK